MSAITALQVGLRTAQITRQGMGKAFHSQQNGQYLSRVKVSGRITICLPSSPRRAFGGIPFIFSAIEHIQKQGLQNIVAMVARGDFGRA